MKKIFTFLGIAVLATSLMTACGDKEEEEGLAEGTYRIEKGDTTWDAATIEAVDFTNENYITLNCKHSSLPIVCSGWLQAVAGTFDSESSQGDYMRYRDDNDLVITANNDTLYNFYPNTDSWSETINAIDLTALTLSGNWSEQATTYADAENNYNQQTRTVEWASCTETYTLKGTMQNIHWDAWTPASSKSDYAKKPFTPEYAR